MALTDTITPEWLKKRYLFGIRLSYRGEAYPDELFEHDIAKSVREVEAALGVSLSPVTVEDERHDVDSSSGLSYHMVTLAKRPVWEVTGFNLRYGGFDPAVLPLSWVAIRSEMAGQLQILPARESLAYALAGLSGLSFATGAFGGSGYVPGLMVYSYRAGYDGVDHPYPEDLLALVGLKAAMLTLDTAGDLIAGAGIASISKSVDGISQSINTTSSATNAGYGARIIAYQKRYDDLLRNVYRDYHPVHMSAI